jgi:hypothetical protein
MSDTYGPNSSASLASANLQSSLESRLQALTAGRGSILYSLTWKRWTLPSQRQISALRALGRRTSDNACTGWPSPTANDAKGSAYTYSNGDHSRPALKLLGAARLAGWPTPQARDGHRRKGQAKRNFPAGFAGEPRGQDRTSDPWGEPDWLDCADGTRRPTQPGVFPLANGVPERVDRLRALGNAIVPQLAATFIEATIRELASRCAPARAVQESA